MATSSDRFGQDRSTADAAWLIMTRLMAGIVFYGGIGWVLSLWLGHRSLFVAVGVIVGVVLSLILVQARIASPGAASTTNSDGITTTNGGRP